MTWKGSGRSWKTTQILSQDADQAATLTEYLLDFLSNEVGTIPEEAIPALMAAAVVLALQTSNPAQALDEAVALLDRMEERT